MKYVLVLYMCSMLSGQCPSSTFAGYQFTNHYDCVNAGYGLAQQTFRSLQELEEAAIEVHYMSYYRKWVPQENYYYAVEKTGFEPTP